MYGSAWVVALAQLGAPPGPPPPDPYAALAVFARVLGHVEQSYVDEISPDRLVRAAIRGLVEQLDGPNAYLDPEAFAALRAEARSGFGGIGVVLEAVGPGPVVRELVPGGPASVAGLAPGDRIEAVDGWSTRERPLSDLQGKLTGPPGSSVALRWRSPGEDEPRSARLVRAWIRPRAVTGRRFRSNGYLRIPRFDERTAKDVLAVLADLRGPEPIGGLVLDLRVNPGGLLESATRVADLWLDRGSIVVTEGRNRPVEAVEARAEGTEPNYPVAVLVDEETASAAEILAGALKDRGRARLFGRRTFGKGTVQTLIELEDGSALKLTVARYFTPGGHSIDGRGIPPDEEVEGPVQRLGDPALDPPLARALAWLDEGER